jgi:hypothetical protein
VFDGNESSVFLQQEFANYNEILPYGSHENLSVPEWFMLAETGGFAYVIDSLNVSQLTNTLFNDNHATSFVQITKMYFCNQIVLETDEYSMHVMNRILYYKVLGTYLQDGQFSLVTGKDSDQVVSICLEDSEFGHAKQFNYSNAFANRPTLILHIILQVLVLIF